MAHTKTGDRDRKITIEAVTKGKSTGGAPTETWTTLCTPWAKVRSLTGREYYAAIAAQVVAQEMLAFDIRFRSDVRPSTARVQYQGRIYNIRRVEEVGRKDSLVVYADTVAA